MSKLGSIRMRSKGGGGFNLRDTLDRADQLRKDGQLGEAVDLLRGALDSASGASRAEFLFQLGNLHVLAEDLTEAESAYTECLDLNGRHANAMNNLAIVYKRQDRKDLFRKTYRRSIWLAMRSPRSLLGTCRERSPARIAMRWVILLALALGVMALLRWLSPG